MIIMQQLFLNRKRELAFLNRKYTEPGSQLIVIYGRRCIGKTELIKEFLMDRKGTYIYCTRESFRENMNTFTARFRELTGKRYFEDITSLATLFETLVDVLGDERIVVAIDEFPYLISVEPSVPSQLQKIYDEIITGSNIYLILCGSSMEMMEREVLDYRSPLYGRKTGEWKLEPFSIRDIANSTNLSARDIFLRWARFGGTPAYFLRSVKDHKAVSKSYLKAASELVLTKGEPLYNEPLSLLREELREPRTYIQLLRHISSGVVKQGKLQHLTGLDKGNISKYLDVLISLGYLERVLPVGRKRGGQYRIKDPFVNFWFRYVLPNLSYLEIGKIEPVMQIIDGDMKTYHGVMFERFVETMIREGTIDLDVVMVSKWWHKDREIDLVGVGKEHAVFVEVKWRDVGEMESRKILNDLRNKIKHTGIKKEKAFFGLICRDAVGSEHEEDEFILTLNDLDKILQGPGMYPVLPGTVQ